VKRLDSSLVSLVGFAASQWAEHQANNGSNHKRRLRQLVAAGLEIHQRSELYAAAPSLLRSLQRVADHATIALQVTASDELPPLWKTDPAQTGGGSNGSKGRKDQGAKQGAEE
jgi:hypothetical protein